MKLNLSKSLFIEKLTLATRFTATRLATSPALQGILLKTTKGVLHLYSTSLTQYFHTSFKANVETDLQFVVEPRKLLEFLGNLSGDELSLEFTENTLIVSQAKTKGVFPVIQASDFPLPPKISDKGEKLESAFFENLKNVLFCASADESRPVLTGILFEGSENELTIVATDGFRLSLTQEKGRTNFPKMIIPASFLQEITKASSGVESVQFLVNIEKKIVCFEVGDDSFYSHLIEGEFPPYERVIPAEHHTTVIVDRTELLRSLKLVSVFARDFSNVVVANFAKDEIELRPKKEANQENKSVVEAKLEGEAVEVAFNLKYLTDFLSHVSTPEVQIEVLRSDAPVGFRIPKNKHFLHVIMPVRLTQ